MEITSQPIEPYKETFKVTVPDQILVGSEFTVLVTVSFPEKPPHELTYYLGYGIEGAERFYDKNPSQISLTVGPDTQMAENKIVVFARRAGHFSGVVNVYLAGVYIATIPIEYDIKGAASNYLTFEELADGEKFIHLPVEGDNSGHGGFKGTSWVFQKLPANEVTESCNSIRLDGPSLTITPAKAKVLVIA